MDVNSLSHTKWNCKYHIVFAPKFRRKVAYGELKQDIANILSMLCKRKGVKIVEGEICPDPVHMLVEIPPSISVLISFTANIRGNVNYHVNNPGSVPLLSGNRKPQIRF